LPPGLGFCLLFASLLGDADVGATSFRAATNVRVYSFEVEDDQDYDGQPDDWSRRIGKGFPHYVACAIDRTVGAAGRQSLRFDLNGAQAALYSPPLPIDTAHSWVIDARLKTKDLHYSAAVVSVSILDHRRTRLRRYLSQPVSGTTSDWTDLRIGPIHPDPQARFLVLGCHIIDADRSDIHGQVWFDDLRIGSLPQMRLTIDPAGHILGPGLVRTIRTDVEGLERLEDHELILELSDVFEQSLHREAVSLSVIPPPPSSQSKPLVPLTALPGAIPPTAPPAAPTAATTAIQAPRAPATAGQRGFHAWQLTTPGPGYYRIRASLRRAGEPLLMRDTALVIVDETPRNRSGEFGWSLPQGGKSLRPEVVAALARESGIHQLKLPLWTAARVESAGSTGPTSQLVSLLEADQIRVIGLLNDPPQSLAAKFAGKMPAAGKVFSLPRTIWAPELEPLVARYAFRVKHWQLGDDFDYSLEGLSNLPQVMDLVRDEFNRIGRDSLVAIPWSSKEPDLREPSDTLIFSRPWTTDTVPETVVHPAFATAASPLRHESSDWLMLKGDPHASAPPDRRAAVLAFRMLSAKLTKPKGILFHQPLDDDGGLFRGDGAPLDLFPVWRQLALLLGNASYLGQITLPNRSRNLLFQRDDEVFLVLWNDTPVEEALSFGYDARVVDLWGRPTPGHRNAHSGELLVRAQASPVIVRNCSPGIARWYLALRFEKGRLASEYGQHEEAVLGVNSFPQGVSGVATLKMPRQWVLEPGQWTFQAGVNEPFRLPTLLTFPSDAALGTFPTQIDFEISADRPYRFTVHLPYRLGLEDLDVLVSSRLLPDGRLEVEQRIINSTQPVEVFNFNCQLFIPGRVRQKQFVTRLGQGEDKRSYYLEDGASLIGQELWLRCEQVDGLRVLNHRLTVKP
jgi:hypothetical protein